MSVTILVVDDEPSMQGFLRTALEAEGYRVVTAVNGAEALSAFAAETPDLIFLDLGLPDRDGFAVLTDIRRQSPVPVIVLSAREEEDTKVRALDLGADDYITKPFGVAELRARLRAALRHALQAQGENPVFESGRLKVDLVRREVSLGGQPVGLSPKEFGLLRELVAHAGKVLTHRQLLTKVWDAGHAGEVQYLRVFIRSLRQKLEADPNQPVHIVTELGVGYRLRLPRD